VSSDQPEILRPDIGGRIREAREGLELSQVQFAERLGRAERTVQAWEYNERNPGFPALLKIANETKRPISFFYGDGEQEAA
jgi:transcriptional regulator with XRE-family HTH domain